MELWTLGCPDVLGVVQGPGAPRHSGGWWLASAELGRPHDILAGLVSQGSLEISADAPGLHPIMWPPRLRLCPSSCFGLCCPASAPRAPRRRLLFLLSPDRLFLGTCRPHLGSPRRGWGLFPAWTDPPGHPEATRPRPDCPGPLVLRPPQDEGRPGGRGRAGPAEPGGRVPLGLGHVPGVRAPRLLGPHGGQSALAAGAQLAPPLPQPGQAQSLQPHVCPALGLRHGEGRGGVHRVGVRKGP